MLFLLRTFSVWILIVAVLTHGYFWFAYNTHHPCEAAALAQGKYVTKYTRLKVPVYSCYSMTYFGSDLFGNVR